MSFYCNLTLDGVINNTGAAGNLPLLATNNTLINRAITNIADGTHLWNVTCWDPTNATSNTATPATRRVIVDANAPELITPNVNNSCGGIQQLLTSLGQPRIQEHLFFTVMLQLTVS